MADLTRVLAGEAQHGHAQRPNPVRIYYQPLGIADPNDTSQDVEGPEPPL